MYHKESKRIDKGHALAVLETKFSLFQITVTSSQSRKRFSFWKYDGRFRNGGDQGGLGIHVLREK